MPDNPIGSVTEPTYTLTLNETQLRTISRACELLGRVHLGQIGHVADELIGYPFSIEQHHAIKETLKKVNVLVTGYSVPHASHGIHNPVVSDNARVAYDIHKVIRHQLWAETPDRRLWCVDSDEPFQSSHLPLPTIKKAK